jgi:hypothetical protein
MLNPPDALTSKQFIKFKVRIFVYKLVVHV